MLHRTLPLVRTLCLAAATLVTATIAGAQSDSGTTAPDPRLSLRGGWKDPGQAISNLVLVAHHAPAEGFNPIAPGDFRYINSDMAFIGNYVIQGNYSGFMIWDITNAGSPTLRTSVVCPGGQGDVSVYRNLVFMSAEETRGRLDCSPRGVADTVSAQRFRGVRIFDISDLDNPKQVASIQTCRGSHTHTLVLDPKDTANVYVYVSGTGIVRSANELGGCSGKAPEEDPNTALFRIEVIQVPLAAPQDAKIISTPRLFTDSSGAINGLWKGGTHGEGTQTTRKTDLCHDITVYSAIGLAAGACSGNGILIDIRDVPHPKRLFQVVDPNFAFWHSATFSNDGKKVLFTDEWGGGGQARCRATDPVKWGGDAIFRLADNTLTLGGYYKLPVVQDSLKNCVAHNGSLIPVPGRDIMVQAWYQGGVSVFDFTDLSHPREIAYYDLGPVDSTKLQLGGYWSAYWYNGYIVASEIARGLDLLQLKPSKDLSQNEIDAAQLVHLALFNPQNQPKLVWPASFVVARAYLDQLGRSKGLAHDRLSRIAHDLDGAEQLSGAGRHAALRKLAKQVDGDAKGSSDAARVHALAGVVKDLAST
jgi:hypothetical protein